MSTMQATGGRDDSVNETSAEHKGHDASPTILVLCGRSGLTAGLADAALSLGERLGGEILVALTLVDGDELALGGAGGGLFGKSPSSLLRAQISSFRSRAASLGVAFSHEIRRAGPRTLPADIALAAYKSAPRTDIVLVGPDLPRDAVARVLPVPVFRIDPSLHTSRNASGAASGRRRQLELKQQGVIMPRQKQKDAVKKAILFGVLTAGLYAAVFENVEIVMEYFTKGGVYTLLPVATVFLFSYVHGSFTSNFWSALGIEASSRKIKVETAQEPNRKPAVASA